MIQAIGLMVAAYIITRMIEILNKKDTEAVTASAAVVTILVVLWGVYSLITSGINIGNTLPAFK